MRSREKAELAERAATDASASDLRTRTAVADALDGLARGFAPPRQRVRISKPYLIGIALRYAFI